MSTVASEIYDLFFTRINDPKLNSIYVNSGSTILGLYIEGWLLDAVAEFYPICTQKLDYTVSTTNSEGYFEETLSLEHKLILSKLMFKYWLARNIANTNAFDLFIQDHEFKTHSAAQNLAAKRDYYNNICEEIDLQILKYAYKNNNWDNWELQNFNTYT